MRSSTSGRVGRASGRERTTSGRGRYGCTVTRRGFEAGPPLLSPWLYPRCAGRCPMSAMVKTRRRVTNPIKTPESVEETETGLSRYSPDLKHVGSDAEAPEDAIREEEGPESWEE